MASCNTIFRNAAICLSNSVGPIQGGLESGNGMRGQFRGQEKTMQAMAGAAGLEPVTSAVTGQRSNQLSYAPAMGA